MKLLEVRHARRQIDGRFAARVAVAFLFRLAQMQNAQIAEIRTAQERVHGRAVGVGGNIVARLVFTRFLVLFALDVEAFEEAHLRGLGEQTGEGHVDGRDVHHFEPAAGELKLVAAAACQDPFIHAFLVHEIRSKFAAEPLRGIRLEQFLFTLLENLALLGVGLGILESELDLHELAADRLAG